MSDIQWLLELLQKIFGNQVVGWVVFVLTPPAVLFALMWLIRGIIEITKTTFIPLFYNADQKRKIRRRQRFADYIESEIRRLNQREDWSDFRFAELEAEVEIEGKRRVFSFVPFIRRSTSGLKREKSLSKALRKSQERIILLEGEPGSGKSVALRHVALDIARRAIKSSDPESLIPFYINLKELRREDNQLIYRQTIERFVIASLKRINDRDIDKFLDDEFQLGLENGSWFFLFDSFDEIPEILGAEDADAEIRDYAEAISDFLHGLNACRGVVAARYFKGPRQIGWSRFRILNLTSVRQKELIKRSELTPISEKLLLGNLESANPEIQKFASNPMFLGLLIGYFQANNTFPEHSDIVFDAYINRRLTQDEERVRQRFKLNIEEIRQIAEEIAFCMSASSDLGLSTTRGIIKESLAENGFLVKDKFDRYLDALEFMKLARSDTADIVGTQRVFAFSHRRFQEYFATKLVLAKGNITVKELLTNPKWRETTVVICQTQPVEVVSPIIKEAWALLATYGETIHVQVQAIISGNTNEFPIEFPWPQGCVHLLDLLQDSFSNRIELLPSVLRESAGAITGLATILGSLPHRIWALEVGGIVPDDKLLKLIRPAIADQSRFLSDVAYRQVARLNYLPDDIRSWIRKAILNKLLQLGIFKGINVVFAQVSRLVNSKDYIAVIRGIQFGYLINILSSMVAAGILLFSVLVLPWADKPYVGIITWGMIMIFFSFSLLIVPLTITEKEAYLINHFLVVGISYSFLFVTFDLLNISYYSFLALIYLSTVMPLLLIFVEEFPFEKGIIIVLFTPLIAIQIVVRRFLNFINSLKDISLSKRQKRILFAGFGVLISFCAMGYISIRFIEIEEINTVLAFGATLFMLVIFYKSLSRGFFEERKHAKAWKKWLRETDDNINVDQIIRVLPLLSPSYAYRFIQVIREQDMLRPTPNALHFVHQLIRLVENPLIESEYSGRLSIFLEDIVNNKFKSLLLDELFLLTQKMKLKLQ